MRGARPKSQALATDQTRQGWGRGLLGPQTQLSVPGPFPCPPPPASLGPQVHWGPPRPGLPCTQTFLSSSVKHAERAPLDNEAAPAQEEPEGIRGAQFHLPSGSGGAPGLRARKPLRGRGCGRATQVLPQLRVPPPPARPRGGPQGPAVWGFVGETGQEGTGGLRDAQNSGWCLGRRPLRGWGAPGGGGLRGPGSGKRARWAPPRADPSPARPIRRSRGRGGAGRGAGPVRRRGRALPRGRVGSSRGAGGRVCAHLTSGRARGP